MTMIMTADVLALCDAFDEKMRELICCGEELLVLADALEDAGCAWTERLRAFVDLDVDEDGGVWRSVTLHMEHYRRVDGDWCPWEECWRFHSGWPTGPSRLSDDALIEKMCHLGGLPCTGQTGGPAVMFATASAAYLAIAEALAYEQ